MEQGTNISAAGEPAGAGRTLAWILVLLAVAAGMFFIGINWGLPSRDSDAYLFGSRTPWTGKQILALAGDWDEAADRGADIAMHPLSGRDQPIVLNATDAQRAAIVRRYRLYSAQPDEMITFRALSRMKPGTGDFDPHFFQYGGLWVYPVGALLKLASVMHLVTLRGDLAFYLDHPGAFGRFYVVARAYSAAWGVVGMFVVYALMMEWTGKRFAAVVASLLYCTMPVVVNAAHEAKPHLAGGVLMLGTILLAMRFVRTEKWRWAIAAGACAGAAAGMILTGVVAFLVLPVMVVLRPMGWRRCVGVMVAAGAIGVGVFLASNPYLLIDYLFHREIVRSNVGNYGNFYRPGLSVGAVGNAAMLLGVGMSYVAGVCGVLAVTWLAWGAVEGRNGEQVRRLNAEARRGGLGWLLVGPAVVVLVQFVLLARGKPAEYARFGLTLDVVLAMCVAAAAGSMRKWRWGVVPVLIYSAVASIFYVAGFVGKPLGAAGTVERGIVSRESARNWLGAGDNLSAPVAVWAEPAPYCMPAMDLFTHRIILLPRGANAANDDFGQPVVTLRPSDWGLAWGNTPISWAAKPFEMAWVRPAVPYNRPG